MISDIQKHNGKYLFLQGDVTRKEDCRNTVRSVKEQWGTLDILVNNAGICRRGAPFNLSQIQDWYDVIDVRL
ncbi:MAG: SDR family NAD(P)-dependent oxidoreductase [Actinomycetota bacterium]|nr:SDR family NAD(P)-dependent oxidoreductase [Actinomycetota bacterium]